MEAKYWIAAILVWFVLASMSSRKTGLPAWVCNAIAFAGFLAVVAYGLLTYTK